MRYDPFEKSILFDPAIHRKGSVVLNTYAHYLDHVSALHYTHTTIDFVNREHTSTCMCVLYTLCSVVRNEAKGTVGFQPDRHHIMPATGVSDGA